MSSAENLNAIKRHTVKIASGRTAIYALISDETLPEIIYWGADLPELDLAGLTAQTERINRTNDVYPAPIVELLPLRSRGWLGRPGCVLHRADGTAQMFRPTSVTHDVRALTGSLESAENEGRDLGNDTTEGAELVSVAHSAELAVNVTTRLQVLRSGVVRARASVRNEGARALQVERLEVALPVPQNAREIIDMTGRHNHERTLQRTAFNAGTWVREAWGGRPGHDNATLMLAAENGAGFRRGNVWGIHLAWSGNGVYCAERTTNSRRLLRAGELLFPGEIELGTDESYASPWVIASYGDGIDELSRKYHAYVREMKLGRGVVFEREERLGQEGLPAHRPVLLNTWEAVYFEQRPAKLRELAAAAAELGVERFVVDDGWFRGRRDDTAGLGDWQPDAEKWPRGLGEIADYVHDLGMQFGLWFEPEMINRDSDLARTHPDWILRAEYGPGLPSRNQHVLNLSAPGAWEYLWGELSGLIERLGIDYIKWDHNRPLVEVAGADGRPRVHAQTRALYRLLEALKERFPRLEIESCCGGGGRADLGIMQYCDRMWASDCIDGHERDRLLRNTSILLPPELIGMHIGDNTDHNTGRRLNLDFRAMNAIFGHLGIEWDLARAGGEDATDIAVLRKWIGVYRELEPVLHTGDVYRNDIDAEEGISLYGVVAPDRSSAVYRIAYMEFPLDNPPGRVMLPGLDANRNYRIVRTWESACDQSNVASYPWAQGAVMNGRSLEVIGIELPFMQPDHGFVIELRAC